MIRHPNAWTRARDEIRTAQSKGRCEDRVVSYADAQELPYTQACIKEALRVFPGSGMGLPRVAGKGGLTIGTQAFPEGTVLSIHPLWVSLPFVLSPMSIQRWTMDLYICKRDANDNPWEVVFGHSLLASQLRSRCKCTNSRPVHQAAASTDIPQLFPAKSLCQQHDAAR